MHTQSNLKEPYSARHKEQVNTKNIKKEDRFCMKSLARETQCAKGVFQIQLRISGISFSNNITIPKLRDTTFETS